MKRFFKTRKGLPEWLSKQAQYDKKHYTHKNKNSMVSKTFLPTLVGVSAYTYLKSQENRSVHSVNLFARNAVKSNNFSTYDHFREKSYTTLEKLTSKMMKIINFDTTTQWDAQATRLPDKMKSRINIVQYPANDPCEDRFQVSQLEKSNGYCAAVFDGHGGWQISNHAMKNLHLYLDTYLESASTSSEIHEAINKAFDQFEAECREMCQKAFDIGFSQGATVGSCAIVSIVKGNKLYIANWGDWEGVLLRKKSDGSFESIKIWKAYSANDPEEQQRLK